MSKPRVAVHKFSSCDGCQLGILNLEEELLDLVGAVEIAYFLEATSTIQPGPYDIALVEGSVSTEHEKEAIQKIREEFRCFDRNRRLCYSWAAFNHCEILGITANWPKPPMIIRNISITWKKRPPYPTTSRWT